MAALKRGHARDAPLPPPGSLPLTLAVAGVHGVPAIPYGTYRLDTGDPVRVIVFGQDNLSRVYSVDSSGYAMTVEAAVAIAEGYTERAKTRMVRLTRRFGGVMSPVMVLTDCPVQPGDTIYVLERFF